MMRSVERFTSIILRNTQPNRTMMNRTPGPKSEERQESLLSYKDVKQ